MPSAMSAQAQSANIACLWSIKIEATLAPALWGRWRAWQSPLATKKCLLARGNGGKNITNNNSQSIIVNSYSGRHDNTITGPTTITVLQVVTVYLGH